MTITIDLPAELEQELLEEAVRQGVDPERYILESIEARLRVSSTVPHLVHDEAALLEDINSGFAPEWWDHYEELVSKRRAETLSADEHARLVEMSDELEQRNAHRMRSLVGLARLRRVPLSDLMQALGIQPPAYV
jgi:hypothetical protein